MRYEHRETRIQCVHSRIIDMLVAAVKSAFQKHPQVTARQTNVLCRQLKSRRLQRPVATDRNDLHFNMVMSIPCTSSAEAKRQLSVLLATTTRSASQRCFLVMLPARPIQLQLYERAM
jgi:hypothetical protein